MENPLAVTKAAKAYFQRMINRGKIESIYQYKNRTASMAIITVESHDELLQVMKGAPGFDYQNSDVHELQDGMEAFDAVIAHLEKSELA